MPEFIVDTFYTCHQTIRVEAESEAAAATLARLDTTSRVIGEMSPMRINDLIEATVREVPDAEFTVLKSEIVPAEQEVLG